VIHCSIRRSHLVVCFFAIWPSLLMMLGSGMTQGARPSATTSAKKTPSIELWEFNEIDDAFESGSAAYLGLKLKGGKKELWNPVSGTFLSPDDAAAQRLKRAPWVNEYAPLELSNASSIGMVIKSTGAKCGYTVGVYYTYEGQDEPRSFYIVDRFHPPKRTGYCGTDQNQSFDAVLLGSAVGLSDGRLLLVDYTTKLAVALEHVPADIVSLDNKTFLIPLELLQPALDRAGGDQVARYKALLRTLSQHPATVVRPATVY